ncbi:MAG: hypothetical protein H0V80_17625 [Acidobacteria bacterium]|nr:hypothetical protein [Acidobacteriota bacterium]
MASRRWLLVIVTLLGVLVLGTGVLVGSCVYLVRRQVQVRDHTSLTQYEREAAKVINRFAGVPTLVEDTAGGPRLSRTVLAHRRAATQRGAALTSLHVLVYSTHDEKLVRLTLPFWLLRMSPDGRMDLDRDDLGLQQVRLSVEDVESAGPGPLYRRTTEDSRVLIWTE